MSGPSERPACAATTPAARPQHARCPQCFSRQSRAVEHFSLPLASEPWRVVACRDCGLMYTDPRPHPADWAEYYPDDYRPHRPSHKIPTWHTKVHRRLEHWLLGLYRGYGDRTGPDRRRWLATALAPFLGPLLDPYVLPLHG